MFVFPSVSVDSANSHQGSQEGFDEEDGTGSEGSRKAKGGADANAEGFGENIDATKRRPQRLNPFMPTIV